MKATGSLCVAILAMGWLCPTAFSDQVYRWADDDNIVNFTTTSPPATADEVEIVPIEPMPREMRRSAAEIQAEIDRRVARYHSAIDIMRDTRAAKLGISRHQLDLLEGRTPAR